MTATHTVQIRRGTGTEWSSANPTLASGEFGYESDTRRLKIGDGATAWNNLSYISPGPNSVVASGDISSLTFSQQENIVTGTLVATSDGKRWIYGGTGSKTIAASYVELADVTPDWSAIANLPSVFPPDAHTHTASQVTDFASAVTAAIPAASGGALGVVKIGDNVNVDAGGTISVASPYSLPVASQSVLGGVRQGDNVTIDGTGVISAPAPVTSLPYSAITGTPTLAKVATSGSYTDLSNAPAAYTLPAATNAVLGGVKIGSGVTVAGDGTISVSPGAVAVASTTVLGGVKQGNNVTIDGSGVLTANAPSFASITAKPTTLAGYGITDASAAAQVAVYTTSGTWTKPAGAKAVIVHAIGGGGGGGGGGNRAVGIVVGGGGGGGGGGRTIAWLDASLLPNSVPVTVGAGGLGGTGGTGAGNGTAGTEGGSSFFGNTQSAAWCFAHPGSQGGGGSGTGGGGGASGPGLFAGGPGNPGAGGTNAAPGTAAIGGGGGGGGGQGLTAASAKTSSPTGAAVYGGYGFVVPSGSGAAGISVPANAPLAGTGANGGQSVANGAGGGGGAAGLYGGGGGGGGACTGTAFRAGAGGAGAQGIVVVMTFF